MTTQEKKVDETIKTLKPFIVQAGKHDLPVLDVKHLPDEIQVQVRGWYGELARALPDFGKAGLRIGETLFNARETLKPLGAWKAFINKLPGFSYKTSDRFIKRYQMARRVLPATILSLAQATGIQIAGESDDAPYGRYTRAVKRVGPAPRDVDDADRNLERASAWMKQVVSVYANERKSVRAKSKSDPTERASAQLIRAIEAYATEKREQIGFLKRVLSRTLKSLGYADLIVTQSRKVA